MMTWKNWKTQLGGIIGGIVAIATGFGIYQHQPSSSGSTQPAPPSTTTTAPAGDLELSCGCDLSRPLLDAPKGDECPKWDDLQNRDIRYRAVDPSKRSETVFITRPAGVTYKDGKVTAGCDSANGYHYIGYRCPSASSSLCKDRTGTYQETYRIDYEYRGPVQ